MFVEYLLLLLCLFGVKAQDPIIEIDTGYIMGRTIDYKDKQVHAYYSIPYARPPVGELRFKAPEPAEKWNNTRDVSASKPNACYQQEDTMFGNFQGNKVWNPVTPLSEDCLYITVYVPAKQPPISDANVMVWFHPGGFTMGSQSLPIYDGRVLAAEHDVIVVSMGYRLGALGFLYFDDDEAPGNMGLMDQELALDWVQRNIEAFGGDPNKVTLFGASGGGMSVGLHLIHKPSWSKFHNAILMAGSMNMDYIYPRNESLRRAHIFHYDKLGCTQENITEIASCLREKDPEEILEAQQVGSEHTPMAPVVDGKWIRDDPKQLLKEHKFKKCPILTGVSKNEGSVFMLYSNPEVFSIDGFSMNQDELRATITSLFNHHLDYPEVKRTSSVALAAIEDRLTYWKDPTNETENYRLLEEGYGVRNFSCPIIQLEQEYAAAGQVVYAYFNTHRSKASVWPEYVGVMHTDERYYAWGDPFLRRNAYDDEDRKVSEKVMEYWTDFAKNGNPGDEWPRFTSDEQKYLEINYKFMSEESEDLDPSEAVGSKLYAKQCHFWMELMPILNEEGYCAAGASSVHLGVMTIISLILLTAALQ